ncbi:MAG: hypothetical protein V7784_22750 [Oceanospirillaceae bacterium]
MKSIIAIIGIIGIVICFAGFTYQYRARKHLKIRNALQEKSIKSFKRAPIEDYSDIGKELLSRSDNCAAIGVSMVIGYALLAGIYE